MPIDPFPHSIVRHLPRSLFLYLRSFADGGDLLLDRPSWCRRLRIRSSSRWEERPNYREPRLNTLLRQTKLPMFHIIHCLTFTHNIKSGRERKKQNYIENMTYKSGVSKKSSQSETVHLEPSYVKIILLYALPPSAITV